MRFRIRYRHDGGEDAYEIPARDWATAAAHAAFFEKSSAVAVVAIERADGTGEEDRHDVQS